MTDRIGTPVAWPIGRDPHIAEAPVVAPCPIGLEHNVEVISDRYFRDRLRICRRHDQAGRTCNRKAASRKADQQGDPAKM
jgi:hypothetical protein